MKTNSKIKLGILLGFAFSVSLFGFINDADSTTCTAKCDEVYLPCDQACFDALGPDGDTSYDSPFQACRTACGDVWRKCFDACAGQSDEDEEMAEETVEEELPGIYLTVETNKSNYLPKETVVISGNVSDENGGLAGAEVNLEISTLEYSATTKAKTNSSGNYSVEFPIPEDVTRATYDIAAATSWGDYPGVNNSNRFTVGESGMYLKKNPKTKEPFVGVAADGTSSLGISILLPDCEKGCSDVKVDLPDIGTLEGEAISAAGTVKLDSDGNAEINYIPPAYLAKEQLAVRVDVHGSGNRVWAAEVPLTLNYKNAKDEEWEANLKILVTRPPVMLVHGFLGAVLTWEKMSTYLRGERFDTYLGDYSATGQSIEGLAVVLRNDIRKQKTEYADANIKLTKVDAVGHSMGGLISRYYSHGYVSYDDDLRKLIMVATPNHGVSKTKKYTGYVGAGWYQTHRIPAMQLDKKSSFMTALNSGEKTGAHINPKVQYGNLYGSPDDWVVSATSAYLNGVQSLSVSGVKHSPDITGVSGVAVTEYLSVWNQVQSWLLEDIYRPALKGFSVEVAKFTGDVYLTDYNPNTEKEYNLTDFHTKIDTWQSLRTEANSNAIIHLSLDGVPWGVIYLDQDSEIFLGNMSPQLVEVRLSKGSAAFRGKENGHFTVPVNIKNTSNGEWWKYSPGVVVTGLNTEFSVTAGDDIGVHILEGSLMIDTQNATEAGKTYSAGESVSIDGDDVNYIGSKSQKDFWWYGEDDFLGSNEYDVEPGVLQKLKNNLCSAVPGIICQYLVYIIIGFIVLVLLLLLIIIALLWRKMRKNKAKEQVQQMTAKGEKSEDKK